MRQSERLATATPATVATLEGEKARTVAIVATVSVAKPTETKTALASRWWLVHYLDGASVEVWTDPHATQDEVLERRPDAIAAQPLHQAAQSPKSACSSCVHVTGRGGCGEPVAAGLSDLPGVIRYSPNQGATCSVWQLYLDINVKLEWHSN
jgi:hypothetical protein